MRSEKDWMLQDLSMTQYFQLYYVVGKEEKHAHVKSCCWDTWAGRRFQNSESGDSLQVLFISEVLQLGHSTSHRRCQLDSFVLLGQVLYVPDRDVKYHWTAEYTVYMLNGFNIMKRLVLLTEIKLLVLSFAHQFLSISQIFLTVDVKRTWITLKHKWHVLIVSPSNVARVSRNCINNWFSL